MEEACEDGLPRGTCVAARSLQLVTVAGRCGFSGVFWVGRISDEARPRERSDRGRFSPIGKKPLHNEARPSERSDQVRLLPIGKKASS